jgi:hypothetical protein
MWRWALWVLSYTKCNGNVTFRKLLSSQFLWSCMQSTAGIDFVIVKSAVHVGQCMWRFEAFPSGTLCHTRGQTWCSFHDGETIFWEQKSLTTPLTYWQKAHFLYIILFYQTDSWTHTDRKNLGNINTTDVEIYKTTTTDGSLFSTSDGSVILINME